MEQVLVMAMHMTNIIKVDWLKVVVEDFHNFFRKTRKIEEKTLNLLGDLIYYIIFFV